MRRPRVSIQYLTPYQPNREAFHQAVSPNVDRILTEGAHAVRILWAKHRTMVQTIRSIRSGIISSSRAPFDPGQADAVSSALLNCIMMCCRIPNYITRSSRATTAWMF